MKATDNKKQLREAKGNGIYSLMLFILILGLLTMVYFIGFLKMDPEQIYRTSSGKATVAATISIIPLRNDENILQGQQVFEGNCVACHGQIGNYLPGLLGPDLIDNEWSHSPKETDMYKLISQGINANISKSGNIMPARGGALLKDEQLWHVIYYLSSLNASITPDSVPTEKP